MSATLQWSTGKVLYVYFCGILLGASLAWLVGTLGSGESVVGPVLGIVLGLLLPGLPAAQALRTGPDPQGRPDGPAR